METILTHLAVIGWGLCLLMAVEQLFSRSRNMINAVSFTLFFCNASIIMGSVMIAHGVPLRIPGSIFFFITSLYAVGPLNLFYYNSLVRPREMALRRLIMHLAPALLVLAGELAFQFQLRDARIAMLGELLGPSTFTASSVLVSAAAIHALGYLSYLVVLEILLLGEKEIREEMTVIIAGNILAILSGAVLFLGFMYARPLLYLAGGGIITIIHMFIFIEHGRSPHFFQILKRHIAERKYRKSLLGGVNTDEIAGRLEYLMSTEKLYRDYELTLPKLAGKLLLSPHQLSRFLNERLGESFQNFVNRRRVEEACRLLREEAGGTILSICFNVGFSSKSAFNRAFKKFTGKSPTDLRSE